MFDAPDLPPMLACEVTPNGWLGLTEEGELLYVEGKNGRAAALPDKVLLRRNNDEPIGYRTLPKPSRYGLIDDYKKLFDRGSAKLRINDNNGALADLESAIAIAPTVAAKHNHALALLALGRWPEGFAEYAEVERHPIYMKPQHRAAIEAGLKRWHGEDLTGKRILLIHDHGLGDSIQCLRYVPVLQAMGADVVLQVPPELKRLAEHLAPTTSDVVDADYFCSLLFLLEVLQQTPDNVPLRPYLKADPDLVRKWVSRIDSHRWTIGVAWTPGKTHDGDYPRAIPLAELSRYLETSDVELFSVQQQGAAEAEANFVGHFEFEDFADCAALMWALDEITTIDTAAAHLAGAIGHPNVNLLLGHWASWRWLSPLYEGINILQQQRPGDWTSLCSRPSPALSAAKSISQSQ